MDTNTISAGASAGGADTQKDTILSVQWISTEEGVGEEALTFLTGTLSVSTALASAFTAFVLSGVEFKVTNAKKGKTTFSFSYSGPKSAQAVKELFKAGASILLSRN